MGRLFYTGSWNALIPGKYFLTRIPIQYYLALACFYQL